MPVTTIFSPQSSAARIHGRAHHQTQRWPSPQLPPPDHSLHVSFSMFSLDPPPRPTTNSIRIQPDQSMPVSNGSFRTGAPTLHLVLEIQELGGAYILTVEEIFGGLE
ncbi:hypothetical protein BU16DRAFT_582901 [Lophium mytilinum]|uniref:Uncharacterized protein n=1 Tax=Lophium mytilinum TaxID=390894 RepID=A0A6A6QPE4_9PEZI|nr:hypothetical protein BU16DRAFT_582901 [Lophium mytilinum]